MYCICCKKDNVIPLDITSKWVVDKPNEEDLLWKNEKNEHSLEIRYKTIQNEMIDNGIIHIIDAGYGSRHDDDRIILAICDDCIKENLEDGTLLLFKSGSYVNPEEDLEKSKKIYRRRKRLDNLID